MYKLLMQNESPVKRYFFYLLFNIIISAILYNTVGIYSEELAEIAHSIAHNGLFVSKPVHIWNNCNCFTIVTYILSFLKVHFSSCNPHGLLLLFLSCVYMTNYFMVIQFLLNRYKNSKNIKLFSLLVFILSYSLMIDELLFIQYTKISFHLVASGIILYNLHKSVFIKSITVAGVIAGMLIRFDTFFVVAPILIFCRWVFLGNFTLKNIFEDIKLNLVFIISFIAIVVFAAIPFTKADKIYEPYRDIIYSFEGYKINGKELKLKSTLDSIKYQMIENHFYNEITIEEMYAIGIKPKARNPVSAISNFSSFRLKMGLREFSDLLNYNSYVILVYFLCLIGLILVTDPSRFYRILLVSAFTIILIMMIAVYIKVEERVAFPILHISFLLCLFYCLYSQKEISVKLMSVFFISILFLFYVNINPGKIRKRMHIEKEIISIQQYFNANKDIKVVYWDLVLFYLFINKEASNSDLYNPDRDFMVDNSLFYIMDEYRDHMIQKFSTYNFKEIIDQSVNDNKKVFFSTEEKMSFYIRFLHHKYNLDVVAKKTDSKPLYQNKSDDLPVNYYLFYLTK